jgi:hypothetical protein
LKYRINYKIWDDFLQVELAGSYPLDRFVEIQKDMDEVIDSNNIERILVDLRKFEGRFGVFDGLKEVEQFRPESKMLRFAILDLPDNKKNNDFFENASVNRGYKLIFFYDVAEAKKWLQVENYSDPQKKFVKEY